MVRGSIRTFFVHLILKESTMTTTTMHPETYELVSAIARYLDRETERERRFESEYRSEGNDHRADASLERAFAYECAHSFVLGVMDSLDASCAI